MRIGLLIILIAVLCSAVYFFRADIPYLNNLFQTRVETKKSGNQKAEKKSGQSAKKKKQLNLDEKTKEQIKEYFKGIEVKPENNNVKYAIHLDHKVGRKQISQGKLKEAYKTYQKVLVISYDNASIKGLGIGLGMLAHLLAQADDYDASIKTYLLEYKITKLLNDPQELGVVELDISKAMSHENPNVSLIWLLKAKESLKNTKYKYDSISVQGNLANKLYNDWQFDKAEAIYKEAWNSALKLGNSRSDRWTRWGVGKNYSNLLLYTERHSEALNILQTTLKDFKPDERQSAIYTENLFYIASTYSKLNDHEQADKFFKNAYLTYQAARSNSLGDEGRAKLDATLKNFIDEYINHLISSNKYLDALIVIESNKAQTLNDIMQDTYQKDVYQQLSDLNAKHQAEIKNLYEKDPDNIETLGEDYFNKYIELTNKQQQERQALEISLNIRTVSVSKSITVDDINNVQKQLPKDTAILSYYISKDLSGLFILERDKKQFIKLNGISKDYSNLARELRATLINPYTDFYLESSTKLYYDLFAEAQKQMSPSVKNLIVITDAVLNNIPFSPLYDGKSFLIEKYSIHRIPSLRFIKSFTQMSNKSLSSGVACVDPEVRGARLPFQAETGDYMKKLYSSNLDLISGKDCSVTTLTEKINSIKTPSFLHIGAHGNFYSGKPMESSIYLSNSDDSKSGIWTAQDIATADLSNIPLVTLSSCETGLSDISKRRDVFGFHRALFFAGTKSVVSPLWAVHDKGTAFLMQNFYKSYSSGNNAVNSLKEAQLSSIKNKEYSHPFYWSAYTLTGLLL